MTRVADDKSLGKLSAKQHEIYKRYSEGVLPEGPVLESLQEIIEGRFHCSFPPDRSFRIELEKINRTVILNLIGDFSSYGGGSYGKLKQAIEIEESSVALDMSKVTKVDSSSIAALMAVYIRLKNANRLDGNDAVCLVNPSEQLLVKLNTMDLLEVFTIVYDLDLQRTWVY